MSTPPAPSDVTVNAINTAKTAQLKKWIEDVNTNQGRHILNKSGKLADLRERVARHYGLDLAEQTQTSPKPTQTPSGDDAIREYQWGGLVSLGEEWETAVANNKEFRLTPEGSDADADQKTLEAVLKQLEVLSTTRDRVLAPDASGQASSEACDRPLAPAELHGLPNPHTPSGPLRESSTSVFNDQNILKASKLDITALDRAKDLEAIIDQIERGDVMRYREEYGPKEGRPTPPIWEHVKNAVTRRERLANELRTQFHNDKEQLITFFTIPHSDTATNKRKRKQPDDPTKRRLRPFRKIIEAIPARNQDLATEKRKPSFQVDGLFSSEQWERKWAGLNDWEIWREIGGEHY